MNEHPSTLKTKLSGRRGVYFASALLLNALFLLCTVLIVNVGFESNDDLTLASFVDGQRAQTTAYIPYMNIVLGALLKAIYAVLGHGAAWHALGQYVLLFAGFGSVTWVLLRRLGLRDGAAVSVIMLLFFGVNAYTVISYTKTAAVCTVGGMALLLQRENCAEAAEKTAVLILGAVQCLSGFMLRYMEFLPCFAIMATVLVKPLWELLFENRSKVSDKFRGFSRLVLPFAAVLIISAGLYALNEASWSKEPWSFYHEYDALRVELTDYGVPEYEKMQEDYDAVGMDGSAVKLLGESNYYDTEVFSAEKLSAVIALRDESFPSKSMGECLGELLDKAAPSFFAKPHVYGFVLMLMLWLAAGEHRVKDWLTLCAAVGVFAVLYMYLIYRGRYMIDRVDGGLFFSMAAALAFLLQREKLENEKLLTAVLLLLSVCTSFFLTRANYRSERTVDRSEARAAVEALMRDEEHLFLAKFDTVSDMTYAPFEAPEQGYWDKIIWLGGWCMNHPSTAASLKSYGVENPYRDAIDNNSVYIIDDNIELTLDFIHRYYDSDASAELVPEISAETGLMIYRIIG